MKKFFLISISVIILSGCHAQSPSPLSETTPQSTASPIETPVPKATAQQSMMPTQEPIPSPTETPTQEPTEEPPQKILIGKASTPLLDKGRNRIKNIRLAAEQISGTTIAAGETFSFNRIVGDRSEDTGYKPAPVIVNGERQIDYGGGVCQLATTIMQAANTAELKITERHDHQKEVEYAEQGNDAAVNYDTLDMKFVNNTEHAIRIIISLGNNTVTAEIYRVNY